ncbi:MAG: hypothetical protein JNN00_05465 [Chitinophagaceae bacterium]|nr:hypothetical protein [Chitinophagaceae bacterium]
MNNDFSNPGKEENVIADYADELKQIEMESYETAVKKARNALFWTAGLVFLGEMISMLRGETGFDPIIFVIALIEAGIFVALALWTKKKPYTAVVTGLIAFLGIIALSAVAFGILEGAAGVMKALISGIIVKVIILVTLIKALSDARALQKAKEERS